MRILFVDDHEMNRRVVRGMLDIAGVSMDEASDAETGLRMIDTQDYDLVLMDLRMPGMDGLTAIRKIRSRGDARGRVPVVVLTADMGLEIEKSVQDAGGDDLVHKPVVMESLFDAIARMMSASDEPADLALA
ncbi:MAG: response regulator [Alphaproteobacteria bacterium PA2]|nr:MAG: response regulator [Alphaproteobacteria bacterium PA2]